jgi:hypothetical protein
VGFLSIDAPVSAAKRACGTREDSPALRQAEHGADTSHFPFAVDRQGQRQDAIVVIAGGRAVG